MKNQFTYSGKKVNVDFSGDAITIGVEGEENIIVSKQNIFETTSKQLPGVDPVLLSKLLWFLKKKLPSIKGQDVRNFRGMIEAVENILKEKKEPKAN